MNKWIGIGQVIGSHGLNGCLKIKVEDPRPGRFYSGQILHLKNGKIFTVEFFKDQGYQGLLKLSELKNREEADKMKGQIFYIDEKELPELKSNAFYVKDLIGLSIQDSHGHVFGKLDRVVNNVANDIFVMVDQHKREVLIPAVKAIILSIEPENKRIIVNPIEGLFHED